MPGTIHELATFLHLAQTFWRQKKMSDRDRLLVLGGSLASESGLSRIAAYCRQLVLQNNHGHMIRRWDSFAQALGDEDFMHFLRQLRRRFPLEKAESILSSFDIQLANERATYFTDEEYAAAILGVDLDWLAQEFDE